MAQDLTEVTPKLLAGGLMTLRQNAIVPRLVNRRYELIAGDRGSTIDVPIPSAVTAQVVTAAATPPAATELAPTSVPIPLDQWQYASFAMSDKEYAEIMDGVMPMEAEEAIKVLANAVNNHILGKYKGVYGFVGTGGTTPFGSGVELASATDVRKILNNQLAPLEDRSMLLDPDAEAAALKLRALQDTSWRGQSNTITEGQIGRAVGFDWFMSQLMPTHTAGTAAAATVTTISNNAAGATTATLDLASGTATLVVGDILSFATHTQTYTVTAAASLDTTGVVVSFTPGLKQAVDGSGTPVGVTVRPTHLVNLGFHRDAFALASRTLQPAEPQLNVISRQAVDRVSGLVLRLTVSREWFRTRWTWDILWGAALVRPELACRLAG